jgi:hypothetical protein
MSNGYSTKNVFDLVHHFGTDEDQMSANFGFILTLNRKVLLQFLELLDIPTHTLNKKDIDLIDIETQVPHKIIGETGRIDLQIKLAYILRIKAWIYSSGGKAVKEIWSDSE